MSERLEEIRGRQRLRHGGSQIAFGDIGYLLVRLDKAEAERDALRADLQEARDWIQALRDEVNSEGPGWVATTRRDIVARAEVFLARTALDERRCHLCEAGFPQKNGVHYGTQALGMIPDTPCTYLLARLDEEEKDAERFKNTLREVMIERANLETERDALRAEVGRLREAASMGYFRESASARERLQAGSGELVDVANDDPSRRRIEELLVPTPLSAAAVKRMQLGGTALSQLPEALREWNAHEKALGQIAGWPADHYPADSTAESIRAAAMERIRAMEAQHDEARQILRSIMEALDEDPQAFAKAYIEGRVGDVFDRADKLLLDPDASTALERWKAMERVVETARRVGGSIGPWGEGEEQILGELVDALAALDRTEKK